MLSSPLMTVAVLAVLWLIVVVPMVVRRNDERRRDRSVAGFGRAMRMLGRRVHGSADPSSSDVFVSRDTGAEPAAAPTLARRPIPAAREAHMYPVDRSEMSAARAQMMARRRRSLTILGAGSVVFTLLALFMGGMMWFLAAPFLLGLGGYLYFLRTQALRDSARLHQRQQRAASRTGQGYDATQQFEHVEQAPTSIVHIDDDDLELHNLDTVDLTGLYNDEHAGAVEEHRRAS